MVITSSEIKCTLLFLELTLPTGVIMKNYQECMKGNPTAGVILRHLPT